MRLTRKESPGPRERRSHTKNPIRDASGTVSLERAPQRKIMEHLWTPWRSVYMKEKKNAPLCIFCEAAGNAAADEPNLVVFRGDSCLVMLNKYPYTSGHVMIAPFAHVSRLAGLSESSADEMMRIIRNAERAIERAYHPDGLNLGMNLGEAAGAGIDQHIHMHVLPRWKGDSNFMTCVSETRIIPEALQDTYSKLRDEFANIRPGLADVDLEQD